MRIVADSNIACVEEAFGGLGEVRLVPGRDIRPPVLRGAELLLVRSVTRITAELLEGSGVRFVGTATSGIDHIDRAYLQSHGIGFAAAPGSNARAVAEYVLSAVLVWAERLGRPLHDTSAGIIGCGQVGTRVAHLLQALGIGCVLNDPPLEERTGDPRFRGLREALQCDIVTLHVPLTRSGPHATSHLIDARGLAQMKPEAILINSARGGIVDEAALLRSLEQRPRLAAVLDCWEGEPYINAALLERATLASPHVAGYSVEAKLRATEALYRSVCRWLGVAGAWNAEHGAAPEIGLDPRLQDDELLRAAVLSCYDIRVDDRALRALPAQPAARRGEYFDRLRGCYRQRRELASRRVLVPADRSALSARLSALGLLPREQAGVYGTSDYVSTAPAR